MRQVGELQHLFHDTVQYVHTLFIDMYLLEVINGIQVVVCCPMGIAFKREVQAAGVAEGQIYNNEPHLSDKKAGLDVHAHAHCTCM